MRNIFKRKQNVEIFKDWTKLEKSGLISGLTTGVLIGLGTALIIMKASELIASELIERD